MAPPAVCLNGHFASVAICSLLWSSTLACGARPGASTSGRRCGTPDISYVPTVSCIGIVLH